MPNYQRRIVYLSEAQREELFSNGSITVNGTTITYDANDMYVTPQEEPYIKPASGIPASDLASGVVPDLTNYVQKTDYASTTDYGVVKIGNSSLAINPNNGGIMVSTAGDASIKAGANSSATIVPLKQHVSTFYGLAKAAGDTTQAQSDNVVGTYTDDAKTAIKSMLGVSEPTDVQINGTSIVQNGIASIPIASNDSGYGLVKTTSYRGLYFDSEGRLEVNRASTADCKAGAHAFCPVVPSYQHYSVFYGLAKAAGADEKDSTLSLGTYSDNAKTAIRTMIGAAAASDIPNVPVQDVQIENTSIVTNGIANFTKASYYNFGVVKTDTDYGTQVQSSGHLNIVPAEPTVIQQAGTSKVHTYRPITPRYQHYSTFYGLAKAAGDTTQSQSSNAVGTYTDTAKANIQHMLGIDAVVAPTETDLQSASRAYNVGDVFMADGKLYTATQTIASGGIVNAGTNCVQTDVAEKLASKANKNNTVLTGSLSMGRLANSQVGENSTALGTEVTANDLCSFSTGYRNISSGAFATTVGYNNTAYAKGSFAGGMGAGTTIGAEGSFAFGRGTSSQSAYMTSFGLYNALPVAFPAWVAGASYAVGDRVKYDNVYGYECTTANSDAEFNYSHWKTLWYSSDTAFTIGNGTGSANRSNALKVDIDGNTFVNGNVYVNCNAYSSGGTKLVSQTDYATSTTAGVVKTGEVVYLDNENKLRLSGATATQIKNGANANYPITPSLEHSATFYGLAKAAGDTTQSQSENAVGTYTDDAKTAIRTMLGAVGKTDYPPNTGTTAGVVKVDNTYSGVSISETNTLVLTPITDAVIKSGTSAAFALNAKKQHQSVFYGLAKAAGDTTQAQSDNAVGTYTADASAAIRSMLGAVGNTDYATTEKYGLVKVGARLAVENGALLVQHAALSQIQSRSNARVITPMNQHYAAFYGLGRAAKPGAYDTIGSVDSNTEVCTYTNEAKAAIQTMLGVESGVSFVETISGTTPSITGEPNTRYMCGEVSSLSITAPPIGTIVVLFTSGSTPAVLTITPPSGKTIKWPAWFNPLDLTTNTTYEISIMDGTYGGVMTW